MHDDEQSILYLTSFLGSPHNANPSSEMSEASNREMDKDCKTNTITTNAESLNSITA